MKNKYILSFIVLLSFLTLPNKVDATINYIFMTDNIYTPSEPPKVVDEMVSLARLYDNFNRHLVLYDDHTNPSDTLNWSNEKTLNAALETYRHLLTHREQLSQMPGDPLMESLRARRIWRQLRDEEGVSVYRMVLQSLSLFGSHSPYDYSDQKLSQEMQDRVKSLMDQEIHHAVKAGLYDDAVWLVNQVLATQEPTEKLNALKAYLPLFQGHDTKIKLMILEEQKEVVLPPLREQLSYDAEGHDQRWYHATEQLRSEAQELLKSCHDSTLIADIKTFSERLYTPDVRIEVLSRDYTKKVIKLRLFGVLSFPATLMMSISKEAYGNRTPRHKKSLVEVKPSTYHLLRAEVNVPLTDCGYYHFELKDLSQGVNSPNNAYESFMFSLMNIKSEYENSSLQLTIQSTIDGQPLKGVKVEQFSERTKKIYGTYATDRNGIVAIPYRSQQTTIRIRDHRLATGKYTSYVPQAKEKQPFLGNASTVRYYTDRPLYRYGQKVHIGLVTSKMKGENIQLRPKVKGSLLLKGRLEGRTVTLSQQRFISNEDGIAQMEVTLPDDERYEDIRLEVDGIAGASDHYLNVQSYQLNHLQVTIDSIPTGCVVGKPMTVYGQVTDMNGHPSPASIKATWTGTQIEGVTGKDGSYKVTIPEVSKVRPYMWGHRQLTVVATDPLGNIAEASYYLHPDTTNFPLSSRSVIEDKILNKLQFTLSTEGQPYLQNKLGELDQYKVYAYLINDHGQRLTLGELPLNGKKTFERPDLKSGAYTLGLEATDKYGQCIKSEVKEVAIYAPSDRQVPIATPVWLTTQHREISDDTPIDLQVGSDDHTTILIEVSTADKKTEIYYLSINKEIKTFKLPAIGKAPLSIKASTFRNGVETYRIITIGSSDKATKETLSITGIEDDETILPGGRLQRTLKVLDEGGRPMKETMVVVTIFDDAVSQAAHNTHFWPLISPFSSVPPIPIEGRIEGIMLTGMQSKEAAVSEFGLRSNVANDKSMDVKAGMGYDSTPGNDVIIRSHFAETAYFNALLKTNASGEVLVDCQMPDTQTAYKVKVFAFTADLNRQKIEDFKLKVFSPLSISLSTPRYLMEGDSAIAVALMRNADTLGQHVQGVVMQDDQMLGRGEGYVASNDVSTFSFPLIASSNNPRAPMTIVGQVKGEHGADAVRQIIPVLSSSISYSVGIPISGYRQTRFDLDLKKVTSAQPMTLELYTDPLNVLLSKLAINDADGIDPKGLFLFGTVNAYTVWAQLAQLMKTHPELTAHWADQAKRLEAVAETAPKENPDGRYESRQASPASLAKLYRFISDRGQVDQLVKTLDKQICDYGIKGKGFSYDKYHYSPWLTVYVMRSLKGVDQQFISPSLRQLIISGIEYLDQELQRSTKRVDFYFDDILGYSLARQPYESYVGTLPSPLQSKVIEAIKKTGKGYRKMGVSRLFDFDRVARRYAPEVATKVHQFIIEMSKYPRSERESLLFALYLSEDHPSEGLPTALVQFLLQLKAQTIWDETDMMTVTTRLLAQLSPSSYDANAAIRLGNIHHPLTPLEKVSGHVILELKEPYQATLTLRLEGIQCDDVFGGLIIPQVEPAEQIKAQGKALRVAKSYYTSSDNHQSLVTASDHIRKGDELIVRYTIDSNHDLSLLTINDPRPACSEPGYDFVGYRYQSPLAWSYRRLMSHDEIFIDYLPAGHYTIEMKATANMSGRFVCPPTQISSYYAPEYRGNSNGGHIVVLHEETSNATDSN